MNHNCTQPNHNMNSTWSLPRGNLNSSPTIPSMNRNTGSDSNSNGHGAPSEVHQGESARIPAETNRPTWCPQLNSWQPPSQQMTYSHYWNGNGFHRASWVGACPPSYGIAPTGYSGAGQHQEGTYQRQPYPSGPRHGVPYRSGQTYTGGSQYGGSYYGGPYCGGRDHGGSYNGVSNNTASHYEECYDGDVAETNQGPSQVRTRKQSILRDSTSINAIQRGNHKRLKVGCETNLALPALKATPLRKSLLAAAPAAATARARVNPFAFEESNPSESIPHGVGSAPMLLSSPNDPFTVLPIKCRVFILKHLERDDLIAMSLTCKNLRKDCQDYHRAFSTFRVRGTLGDTHSLLRLLCESEREGAFSKFHHLKVQLPHAFTTVTDQNVKEIVQGLQITGITSLDLSVPLRAKKKHQKVRTSTLKALGSLLPRLREINLTNVVVANPALLEIAEKCPLLEVLTWNRHTTMSFLDGSTLGACHNLKELYMDDSVFCHVGNGLGLVADFDYQQPTCLSRRKSIQQPTIFFRCSKSLERVSIRNARASSSFKSPKGCLPQTALINFVRHVPTLRWFRSDLSELNVAMLKAERPEVQFL